MLNLVKDTKMKYNFVMQSDEKAEWDNKKADSNVKKHDGLTFEEANEVFDDPFSFEQFDEVHSTLEEERFIVIGRVKNQLVVLVVYTPRDGNRRIISARYATSKERTKYYERIRKIYSGM